MAAEGIAWFDNGLISFAQKLSVAEHEIDGHARDIVLDVAQRAAENMRYIVEEGGINSTQKGGGRINSGKMLDSIDGKIGGSRGGRVSAEFGFLDGPPDYTVYQELGTTRGGSSEGGIPSMLAFVTAQQQARVELQNQFQQYRKWLPRLF
jgi:hypothetical protein